MRARILTVATAVALMSCESPKQLGPGLLIEDLLPRVSNADGTIQAVLRTGPAPAGGTGNAATITGIGSVVNGGSSQVTVSAGQAYNTVIVAIPGFENYWELTLPGDVPAVASMVVMRSVNRWAVAAGTMRNASTRIEPNASKDATVTAATSAIVR